MSGRLPTVVAVTLLATVAVAGALSPTALAGHDAEANYTVVPLESDPGNGDASYEQFAVNTRDIAYLDYIRADWKEGGFAGCGPTNSEVFGIDRGNDSPGTRTDEGLSQYVEETTVNEDTFMADFYERDDAFGSSTNLAAGDQFVALTRNCLDNPDEPGWYQISAELSGTDSNGETVTLRSVSHYFYVCRCASEEEARRKLGPPPSESSGSPTAAATPTSTATTGQTATSTAAGPATASPATASTAGGADSPTGTPDPASGPDEGERGGSTASRGTETAGRQSETGSGAQPTTGWEDVLRETPTVVSGPGFGPLVALVALAGAALFGRR